MEPVRLRLGELLVDAKIISREQLEEVLTAQKEDGRRLGALLVERGFINETQLTQILSQQLSVPWVSLYHVDFSKRLLSLVPRHVAVEYCLIPIYVRNVRGQGDTLYVAMDDPTNLEALRTCASWAGLPTRAMIASPADIRHAIRIYYGPEPGALPEAAADEPPPEPPPAEEPPSTPKSAPPPPVARAPMESMREELELDDVEQSQEPPAVELKAEPPAEELPADEPPAEEPPAEEPAADEPVPEHAAPDTARQAWNLTPSDSEDLPLSSPISLDAGTLTPSPLVPSATPLNESSEPPLVFPLSTIKPPRSPDSEPQAPADDSVSVEVGDEISIEELLEPKALGAAPENAPASKMIRRSRSGTMLSLTLLDGTTLALPIKRRPAAPKKDASPSLVDSLREDDELYAAPPSLGSEQPVEEEPPPASKPSLQLAQAEEQAPGPNDDQLSARDVLAALRAAAHGVDPTEILGRSGKWEALVAVLLSLMLKKGLITDAELMEELRRV